MSWRKWAERRGRLPVALPSPPKARPKPAGPVAEEPEGPLPEEEAPPRRAAEEAPAFTKQVRLVVTAPETSKSRRRKRKKKKKRKRH